MTIYGKPLGIVEETNSYTTKPKKEYFIEPILTTEKTKEDGKANAKA
jgi:hypothetical protein